MGENGRRNPSASTCTAQVDLLELCERDVLRLLATGCSIRTVGRRLALSDGTVQSYVRKIERKLQVHSLDALRDRGAMLRGLLGDGDDGVATTRPQHLPHQSRWLPDIKVSAVAPLGSACRRELNCKSLRDVADFLTDCARQPGPAPDDPGAVIRHRTGTIGAKQALLAMLAMEVGREDVQLIVACYELQVPGKTTNARPATLPLAVCHLRWRSREIQIAEPGGGSLIIDRPIFSVSASPGRLPAERVQLYRKMALDWCRALDIKPNAFARMRAEQLRRIERRSVFEDLLGHRLPPNYTPIS